MMQGTSPIKTGFEVSLYEKFSPVIVTMVPPRAEPSFGEILVTVAEVVIWRSSESSLP